MRHTILDLTPRQVQVWRLLALGYSAREAAALLGVKPASVRAHAHFLHQRFATHAVTHLTLLAVLHKVITRQDILQRFEEVGIRHSQEIAS